MGGGWVVVDGGTWVRSQNRGGFGEHGPSYGEGLGARANYE